MKALGFLILALLSHAALAQKTQLIAYKAKNDNCQKVNLILFYRYDNQYEIIDYEVLTNKNKEGVFVKELKISENLLALGIGFTELIPHMNEEGSIQQIGNVFMTSKYQDSSTVIKILGQTGQQKSGHLQYFCTEDDYLQQLKSNPSSKLAHGYFFRCLFFKDMLEKSENLMPLFNKYGRALIPELEKDKSMEAQYSLGVLYGLAGETEKMKAIIDKFEVESPTSYLLDHLENVYRNLKENINKNVDGNHEAYLKKCRKYPLLPTNDFAKESPALSYHYGISLDSALKTHEYYYNLAEVHTWRRYYKKTQLYFEYKQLDSAYYRHKELLKNYYAGKMESFHTFDWAFSISEVSDYEYARGNFVEALKFINPAYFHYIANYHQLGFIASNVNPYAHTKAHAHLALNQPDSALKVYTELVKLTRLDSLFEKIESTYIGIHGSKEGYQDYLVQNGIDKFVVETKYAPEAVFKLYGSDKEVSL
ncbi:MAG: hypothetical protein EAZ57_04605, partial [Cytophagales bacterium]